MQIYSVGGAVRDGLLNRTATDRDFVVVGATPEQMQSNGFLAVGRDFPVFLHPMTGEEYALARTERKTAPGYKGFAFHADPSVTLEEDLARRDLTINAMAQDASGQITDPFGGQEDLKARVLRHVGPAFVEDPVRILRVARFAARFSDFSIAPDTLRLMRTMVAAGEVDALVPERSWQELSRGLMEERPSRMLEVLLECGAMERLAPELGQGKGAPWTALDHSAEDACPLAVRCAIWWAESELNVDQVQALGARLRVPSECSEIAVLSVRERKALWDLPGASASDLLGFVERCDALRRAGRFELLMQAWLELEGPSFQTIASRLRDALRLVRAVDAGAVARRADPSAIPEAIRRARLEALRPLAA